MEQRGSHLIAGELDSIIRALGAKFTAIDDDELHEVVVSAYHELAAHARVTAHLIPLTLNRARRVLDSRRTASRTKVLAE